LEKDRKKRLGSKGDADELLNHPWFAEIDMNKLLKKQIEAPFRPKVEQAFDLSNFDEKFIKLDAAESMLPEEGIQKIEAKKDAFENFGFASQDSWYVF